MYMKRKLEHGEMIQSKDFMYATGEYPVKGSRVKTCFKCKRPVMMLSSSVQFRGKPLNHTEIT
jgi:hypothetical protein